MEARQGIRSLETGIRIFQTLHQLGRPVALRELAEATRLHPAKLHRYLVSLVRTGLVAQDEARRYGPGPYAFGLRGDQAALTHAREMARAALPALAHKIDETVFLTAWRRTGPAILAIEEPPKPVSVRPTSTGDLPVSTSATGRVYAAFLPPERLEAVLQAEVPARKRVAFLRELAEVRRRGLARSLSERYPGVNAFSAPIFDSAGNVLLAITAFGLEPTFSASWTSSVARELLACTTELTRRVGGRAPHMPKRRVA